jgi:hypothetical protein
LHRQEPGDQPCNDVLARPSAKCGHADSYRQALHHASRTARQNRHTVDHEDQSRSTPSNRAGMLRRQRLRRTISFER